MEEQAVNNQVQQSNISTPPEPRRHSFLTSKLFLITLVIVVLLTAIYIGVYIYLGSQLDKISKSKQAAISSQPTPTPDPTANWEIYENEEFKFEVRYPSIYKLSEWKDQKGKTEPETTHVLFHAQKNSDLKFQLWQINIYQGGVQEGVGIIELSKSLDKDGKICEQDLKILVDMSVLKCRQGQEAKTSMPDDVSVEIVPRYFYIIFPQRILFEIEYAHNSFYDNEKLISQILSTFKFTDEQEQVACTQDAKLCPDGSYVSRQGPNCEFAACP